jgi:alkylhydroperoxidase family enzyme
MALLKMTPKDKATGKLAELYDQTEQMFGIVPNNVKMLGISPAILENQLEWVGYFREHKNLSAPFQAALRFLVSNQCKSPYCTGLNTMLLKQAGLTDDQIEAAKSDVTKLPFEEKEKALLSLVLKATKDPHSVTAKDVDDVKAQGWSEQDIFDAVAYGGRMVATNTIFDTFKVDVDIPG